MEAVFHEKTKQQVRQNLMAIILAWSGLVVLMSLYITLPLTNTFTAFFHISEANAVWSGSAFSFCYALCCLVYGPIADKVGRKPFLVAGIILLTVSTLFIGFVDQYAVLIMLRILQGLAAAAFAPVSLVYTGEVFPTQKKLAVIGYIVSGFLMASVIAQIFAIVINNTMGWKAIFIILGLLYLGTALAVIFFLPKDQVKRGQPSVWVGYRKMGSLYKNRQLIISFIITFMLLFSLVGMYTILGSFLTAEPLGFTANQVLGIRAIGILGVLTSVFSGGIAGKMGNILAIRLALFLAAVALFATGISESIYFIVFSSLLFVAGIALIVPVNISLVNRNAGEDRGTAVLVNAFILFLGASAGPILATKLTDSMPYFMCFTVFSAVLMLGFLLSLRLKKISE